MFDGFIKWYYGNAPKQVRVAASEALQLDPLWVKIGSPLAWTMFVIFMIMLNALRFLPDRLNFLQIVVLVVAPLLFVGVGVVAAMFFHRICILHHVRTYPEPWCWNCMYMLKELPKSAISCPECGHAISEFVARAKDHRPSVKPTGMKWVYAYRFLMVALFIAAFALMAYQERNLDSYFWGVIAAVFAIIVTSIVTRSVNTKPKT